MSKKALAVLVVGVLLVAGVAAALAATIGGSGNENVHVMPNGQTMTGQMSGSHMMGDGSTMSGSMSDMHGSGN